MLAVAIHEMKDRTFDRVLEKGIALSRAKAHSIRDVEAMTPTVADRVMRTIRDAIPAVPLMDPVAW